MTRRAWTPVVDVTVAVGLCATTAAYLAMLPRDLWTGDEGTYLYAAKRILDGDVPYRDFFEYLTPGAWYLMALAFHLFGTTVATVKVSMAVLHGLLAAALYCSARALRVGVGLAAVAALAHPALCQPTWPYYSPHWFGTFFMIVLLLAMLALRWNDRPARLLAIGVVASLLVLMQQHKGALFAGGVGLVLGLDHLCDRRFGTTSASLVRQLACFVAAVGGVLGPLALALVALVGAAPLVDQLVIFPLVDYPASPVNHAPWGMETLPAWSAYTTPTLLVYAPLAALALLARAAWTWQRRADRTEMRQLIVLVVFAACAVLAIANFPDVIHFAFVAPLFAVAGAVVVDRFLPGRRALGRMAVAGVLLAALGWHLSRNATRRFAEFPLRQATAFGEVAFANPVEANLLVRVRRTLDAAGSRTLFCYPALAQSYLMVDGVNPTRFQWLRDDFFRPEHFREVLATLEAKRVRYVLASRLQLSANDPVWTYLRQHYRPLDLGAGTFPFADRLVLPPDQPVPPTLRRDWRTPFAPVLYERVDP